MSSVSLSAYTWADVLQVKNMIGESELFNDHTMALIFVLYKLDLCDWVE
jgi:hypothetical protein